MDENFMTKIVLLGILFFSPSLFGRTTLQSIDFKQKGEISFLELNFDSNTVSGKKHHLTKDKQIILDVRNIYASDKVLRDLDTSKFLGSVVYVSSYQNPANKNDLRVALQLRDNARSKLIKEGKKLILMVENRFGAFNKKSPQKEIGPKNYHIPQSDSLEDILQNLTLSGKKKYIGKKISLNIREVPVTKVIRMIAEVSGFNIILANELSSLPPMSLNLTNTPWDQVLDIVLDLNKLAAKRNGVILMIDSLSKVQEEAKKEAETKKLAKETIPLVTKIFPISHAKLEDLQTVLRGYLTEGRGSISTDKRTNAMIIKDTEEVLDKVKKIIETLDTEIPQVLIEAKIVEITEDYKKRFGLRDGVSFGLDPLGDVPSDSIGTTTSEDTLPGFTLSSSPTGTRPPLSFITPQLGSLLNLDFSLQLLESEEKAKVISNPKVVTQNNNQASFTTSDSNPYVERSEEGTKTNYSYKEQTATISLNVTPQITNDGSIILDISVQRDDFGAQTREGGGPLKKLSNSLKTKVLIDNGSTIILGGIYNQRHSMTTSGIPYLKDIPILGWLFRSLYAPADNRRELIMFITPRIINKADIGIKQL